MAANPLRYAHADAVRVAKWLDWAFGHYLGGTAHPRGALISLYRSARRELREVLRTQRRTMRGEVLEVLERVRAELSVLIAEAVDASVLRGVESAEQQLGRYIDDGVRYIAQTPRIDITPYTATVLADYEHQSSQVLSLMARGGDATAEIVGDQHRVGLFTPAKIATTGSRTMATALGAGFVSSVGRERGDEYGWMKQTIPAIDERTTETCLRAAGQKVRVDDKFHLTGEPRFADYLDWTPFHWYCRTSVALYLPTYDDGLTEALREDVKRERRKREEAE